VALEGRGLGWFLEVSQVKFDDQALAFYSTNRRGTRHFRAVHVTDEERDKQFLINKNHQSCLLYYESGFTIRSSMDVNK